MRRIVARLPFLLKNSLSFISSKQLVKGTKRNFAKSCHVKKYFYSKACQLNKSACKYIYYFPVWLSDFSSRVLIGIKALVVDFINGNVLFLQLVRNHIS